MSGNGEAGAPATDNVLEVRGLRKVYDGEGAPVRALRGADLTMRAGEFVAVMGPSGCGKSTLLNIVAGLDTPDEGEVLLAGEPSWARERTISPACDAGTSASCSSSSTSSRA